MEAGKKAGAEILALFLTVTDETAKSRLIDRVSKSSATYETYEKMKYELEPPHKSTVPYLVVDSEVDISPQVDKVAKWLSGEIDSIPGVKQPKNV